jgi:hypothetical protein
MRLGRGRKPTNETAHAAVGLDALALVVKVLAGRLGRPREEAAHHDRAGAERERLDDVADVADAAVRDDGDAKVGRELRDGVHGGRLRATDGHDLLRDADAARAHADAEPVRARADELRGLLARDDVAGDHVERGERRLAPAHHVELEHAVPLRAVEHDDVEPRGHQRGEPLAVRRPRADRRRGVQLLRVRALARERVRLVLEQVRARDERRERAGRVDDRELALLGRAQDRVRLGQRHARPRSDELRRHHVPKQRRGRLELDVPVRHNPEQLAADLSGI